VDGIKFYCRATAGRCQGAFCVPRILEIIAEETGTDVTEVSKRGAGSELITRTLPGAPPVRARIHQNGDRPPVPARTDAIVIGAGAAGMASAAELRKRGFDALVIDRDRAPGGVLRQCIHNGFGIHEFGEELTGPEYAERYVEEFAGLEGTVVPETTVLDVCRDGDTFVTRLMSRTAGIEHVRSSVVMLAMGSRERNRGGIQIPGSRPAGVMTAGAAQRLINIEGLVPGNRAVIVGSGDIGLIMARRMKLVGAEVPAVIEIQPVPSGINRNIVQCLDDFSIPLYLGHVVTRIHGQRRVTGVSVAPLENGVPRPDQGFDLECDTVLLSVGLIPENEISRDLGVALHPQTNGPIVDSRLMTSIPGVFASGNVLHIHDLVDYVAEESRRAGQAAADYLDGVDALVEKELLAGSNVRYVAPGRIDLARKNRIYLRSLVARVGATVEVRADGEVVQKARQHHVQPSEMIELTVDGEKLRDAQRVEVAIV
jgi:NADPH-dependent 2,4-dienoyl-CoA reductase/sulfur reductase-like enzyme